MIGRTQKVPPRLRATQGLEMLRQVTAPLSEIHPRYAEKTGVQLDWGDKAAFACRRHFQLSSEAVISRQPHSQRRSSVRLIVPAAEFPLAAPHHETRAHRTSCPADSPPPFSRIESITGPFCTTAPEQATRYIGRFLIVLRQAHGLGNRQRLAPVSSRAREFPYQRPAARPEIVHSRVAQNGFPDYCKAQAGSPTIRHTAPNLRYTRCCHKTYGSRADSPAPLPE